MIEVELPDGTIAEFPEGTPQDVIKGALQKRFGGGQSKPEPQPKSFGQSLWENIVGDDDDTTQNFGEKVGTWLNKAGESMTIGLVGEEASGAVAGMIPGGRNAEERRDFEQQQQKLFEESNPVAAFTADIAGGVIPGLGIVGAASRAPSLGKAVLQGAGYGGSAGGVYGFMEGEGGVGPRINNALWGAGAGAVVGGAAPVAGRVAGRAVQGTREALAGRSANRGLARDLGVSPTAARTATEITELDDPVAMRTAMQRSGNRNMLADSGPLQAGSLDTTMQAPGPGSRTARTRIDGRAEATTGGMTNKFDEVMGAPGGVETARRAIREGTQEARGTAYDTAFSQPIDYSSNSGRALESLQTRIPKEAVDYANKLMRARGERSPQIMARIADDGSVAFESMPDVRQWDYIKQAVQAISDQGDGNGLMGGQTPLGASYAALARNIRDNLKEAVPEYGEALETAADAISRTKAVRFGSTVMNTNTTREDVADMVAGMTGPERDALKKGVRQQIDDLMARVSAVASDQNVDAREGQKAIGLLTRRDNREKLQMILGDDWDKLQPALDAALSSSGLRASVATNSRTMGRDATNEFLDGSIEPSLLRLGKPLDAAKETAATAMGASRKAIQKQRSSVKNELADLLTREGKGLDILTMIEASQKNRQVSEGPALRAALAASLGAGSNAGTAANRLPDWLRKQ